MDKIILIPAYKPDKELVTTVETLSQHEFLVVVVDDGSGKQFHHIFDKISDKAEIVSIPHNGGKGAALKHGMSYIADNYPDCQYVITADADGQHKIKDILRVSRELDMGAEFVLTMRQFSKNMPFRSRVGNALSRYIYTILNGHYFTDNQSGLRGFRKQHLEWLVRVSGNKYDYELNMLYYADKQGIPITTIPIESVYIDNNSSSHFDPLRDTLRIYAQLFYSARVTFATFFVVQPLLILISLLFNYKYLQFTLPSLGATVVCVNILLNRLVVFRKFRYRDYARVIMATIIRYMFYGVFCFFAKTYLPFIPIFFTFNVGVIIIVPLTYLFHKYTYFSKYKDINKY